MLEGGGHALSVLGHPRRTYTIDLFTAEQKAVKILRNIRSQPAQEIQVSGMAYRGKAQEDSRLYPVELLDQPHNIVRVEKYLSGEEHETRSLFAPDALGFVQPAGNSNA